MNFTIRKCRKKREKKENSPNAVKFYCEIKKAHIYINKNAKRFPVSCKMCQKEKCQMKDKTIMQFWMWMKDCPFNNEIVFEKGIVYKHSIEYLSTKMWTITKLIYSMPPAVVHYRRNLWIEKTKYDLFEDEETSYYKFTKDLSVECVMKVPGYDPKLPHWKNKKMDLNCEFVKECSKHLDVENYAQL